MPSSPEEMATNSHTMVETLLKSGARKGKRHDSIIMNENVELLDGTVKIEEMPLTVPCLNHVLSSPLIKQEGLNNVSLKKSASERLSSNKKSQRKQVPARGMQTTFLFNPGCLCLPYHKHPLVLPEVFITKNASVTPIF